MGCLSKSSEDDKTRKEALSTLYDDTIEYAERLRGVNDPVIEELNKMFPDLCENLEKERKKMMSDVAPVLVLGSHILCIVLSKCLIIRLIFFSFMNISWAPS